MLWIICAVGSGSWTALQLTHFVNTWMILGRLCLLKAAKNRNVRLRQYKLVFFWNRAAGVQFFLGSIYYIYISLVRAQPKSKAMIHVGQKFHQYLRNAAVSGVFHRIALKLSHVELNSASLRNQPESWFMLFVNLCLEFVKSAQDALFSCCFSN